MMSQPFIYVILNQGIPVDKTRTFFHSLFMTSHLASMTSHLPRLDI